MRTGVSFLLYARPKTIVSIRSYKLVVVAARNEIHKDLLFWKDANELHKQTNEGINIPYVTVIRLVITIPRVFIFWTLSDPNYFVRWRPKQTRTKSLHLCRKGIWEENRSAVAGKGKKIMISCVSALLPYLFARFPWANNKKRLSASLGPKHFSCPLGL